jgi:hypothetical protein
MLRVPSWLGRDILHRLAIRYNIHAGQLDFDVLSTDVEVAVDRRNPVPSVHPLAHQ